MAWLDTCPTVGVRSTFMCGLSAAVGASAVKLGHVSCQQSNSVTDVSTTIPLRIVLSVTSCWSEELLAGRAECSGGGLSTWMSTLFPSLNLSSRSLASCSFGLQKQVTRTELISEWGEREMMAVPPAQPSSSYFRVVTCRRFNGGGVCSPRATLPAQGCSMN
jgi:hypothetical protein